MKTRIQIGFWIGPSVLQLSGYRLRIEFLNSDCEVIHQAGRTLVVERNEDLVRAQPHDFIRFVLAYYSQAEHLLVERYRTGQIGYLNTHMVDLDTLDGCLLGLSGMCRAASCGYHCETLNQLPARK